MLLTASTSRAAGTPPSYLLEGSVQWETAHMITVEQVVAPSNLCVGTIICQWSCGSETGMDVCLFSECLWQVRNIKEGNKLQNENKQLQQMLL